MTRKTIGIKRVGSQYQAYVLERTEDSDREVAHGPASGMEMALGHLKLLAYQIYLRDNQVHE